MLDLTHSCKTHVQVCDETLGALAYMLKRNEQLPPGPIFTARLEVDYKKVGVVWFSASIPEHHQLLLVGCEKRPVRGVGQ
jgi:hypothetical protein